MSSSTADVVRRGEGAKGDVISVARLAAIGGTKWTGHLVPLCHPIAIESVDVAFDWLPRDDASNDRLRCRVTVSTTGKTGVEMEAITGVTTGLITVYDMIKSIEREASIGQIRLERKSGGKSGHWVAADVAVADDHAGL